VAAASFAVATEKNGNISIIGDKKVMHSAEYLRRYGETKTFIGCLSIHKVQVPEHTHSIVPGLSISCNVLDLQLGKQHRDRYEWRGLSLV
jgi:hypothetical protein